MNINIDCDCGYTIDTGIDKDYDILVKGEDGYHKEVICQECGSKYRIRLYVSILEKDKIVGSSLDSFLKEEGIYEECVDNAKEQTKKTKRTLKVYGGQYLNNQYGHKNSKQTRGIIAAYTKKQACELANIPMSELNGYWSETGNKIELNIATEVGFWVYDMRNSNTGFSIAKKDLIVRIK
jgi:hypothetical protein